MALTESLRFLITSSSAQAQSDLQKLGAVADKQVSKVGKLQDELKKRLVVDATSVAGALTSAVSTIGQFAFTQASDALSAASDLQQAVGGVRAVFGEASAEVEQFGKQAAEAVGLSNAAYQTSAASLGGLLQSLGQTREESARTSRELIQLGADLAATYGGTTADAVSALGGALRGEYDPLQRYIGGVNQAAINQKALNLGLASGTEELSTQAKAAAALAFIFDQTASAQGGFAREVDTFAGQQARLNAEWQNAQAELGQALLPALTKLTEVARDVVFNVSLIGDVFSLAADDVNALVDAFPLLFRDLKLLQSLAPSDSNWLSKGIKSALIVIPGAGFAYSYLSEKFKEAGEEAAKVAEEAKAAAEKAKQIDGASSAWEMFLGRLKESANGASNLKTSLDQVKSSASSAFDSIFGVDKARNAFDKALAPTSTGTANAKATAKAVRTVGDATRSLADAQADLQEAQVQRFLTSLGATSDEITLAQIAERDSTRDLTDAKRSLADAQQRLQKLRETDAASLLDAEAANIEAQRRLVEAERSGDAVELKKAQAELIRTEKALADARNPATVDQLAQAEQDVAAAQDGVTRAEIAAKASRQELNDLINRGRDGSKELADANKAVEQAQRRVEQAEYALSDANEALTESLNPTTGAVKAATDRFYDAAGAADALIQKLLTGKITPTEFATEMGKIESKLKSVAGEAGKTKELDDYLTLITNIYTQWRNIDSLLNDMTPDGFSRDPMNAFTSVDNKLQTRVVLQLDGRPFGEAIVDGLLAYQGANGAIPIRVR